MHDSVAGPVPTKEQDPGFNEVLEASTDGTGLADDELGNAAGGLDSIGIDLASLLDCSQLGKE